MTYLAIVVSAFITILTTAVFFYTEGYEKGYRDAYRSKKGTSSVKEQIEHILMGVWHSGYNRCNVEKVNQDGYDNFTYSISSKKATKAIQQLIDDAVREARIELSEELYQLWYSGGDAQMVLRMTQERTHLKGNK